MSLYQRRYNEINIPLATQEGEYLDPLDADDVVYVIYSSCWKEKLFEASLSNGALTIKSLGGDNIVVAAVPETVDICGQVSNGVKYLKDGKWHGATVQFGKINFIKTEF